METQLKAARQARGWSQLQVITQLAALGATRRISMPTRESLKTQLSRWENGHVLPHEPYRTLLADIFGLTPHDLGLNGRPELVAGGWGGPASLEPLVLSVESVRGLQDLLGQFLHADNAVGPRNMFQLAVQQVATLEPALLSARGRLRQDGLRLCSQFAEFAGWLAQDAGDLAAAEHWTDHAHDFVEELDDAETRAYVLMRKSGIAAERREYSRAVSLSSAACRDLGRLSPHVRALSLRQAAISRAYVRDRATSERAACRAVEEIGDGDTLGGVLSYVTPAYVLMEAGVSAFHLSRYSAAAERLERALAQWPAGFARDRSLCLARLAVVEAVRGNVDVACAAGRDAVAAYRAAGSARVRATLVSLKQYLAPYDRSAFVSELREVLARL